MSGRLGGDLWHTPTWQPSSSYMVTVDSCPGADPTGERDSSQALQKCLESAKNASGFWTIDLKGGNFRLDSPIVLVDTHSVKANGEIDKSAFRLSDGTLYASAIFPKNRYILEFAHTSAIVLDGLRFESNHRGGGVRLNSAVQTVITSCFFRGYSTRGLWATCSGNNQTADAPPHSCYQDRRPGSNTTIHAAGDELIVQHSWFSEYDGVIPSGQNATGTAIETEWSDNIFVNSVIKCSKAGIVLGPGGNENLISGMHFWVACDGHGPSGIIGSDGDIRHAIQLTGGARIFNCQFDRGNQVSVSDPLDLLISGCTFHGGLAGVYLHASTPQWVMRHVIIRSNLFHLHPPSKLPSGIWPSGDFSRSFINESDVSDNMFANSSMSWGTKASAMVAATNTNRFVADLRPQLLLPDVPLTEVSYTLETPGVAMHGLVNTSGGVVVVHTDKAVQKGILRVRVDQSTSASPGAWCYGCPKVP